MTKTPPRSATASSDDSFLLGGDLLVRRIGFGAMRLTDATRVDTRDGSRIWRGPSDPTDSVKLLRSAVDDFGVQLIDTADSYALGENEELIARALHPYRDDLVIATKVGLLRPSPTEWTPLGHPGYLKQQVELSLRRLRTDRIDLLQLHRFDPDYSIADQVGAVSELRDAGKIRHIGLSEVSVSELEEARRTAPIASVQNLYNLAARAHDPVVDYTASSGIAFIPYFPLGVGEVFAAGGVVDQVATQIGSAPSQVALSWLLHRAPNIVPIPGTTSTKHLQTNTQALGVSLTEEQVRRISEGVEPWSRPD